MERRLELNSTRYRRMLTQIARSISSTELVSMKFWCQGTADIGRRVLEDVSQPDKLWDVLEKRGKLSESDTQFLKVLLTESVNRVDLVNTVNCYEDPGANQLQCQWESAGNVTATARPFLVSSVSSPGEDAPPSSLPQTPNGGGEDCKDSGAGYAEAMRREFDMVSEEFGSGWRTFARKLELTEAEMDRIDAKHFTDLKEKIHQAMKMWCGKKCEMATREGLIAALRDCERNKLARKVEQLSIH